MKVEKVSLFRLKIPLKRPYKIATAEMKAFDCTIVALGAENREGLGEAMADIQGYFWETADEVWQFAREQGPKLLGLSIAQAQASLFAHVHDRPCATTPFLTALEMLAGNRLLASPLEPCSVPVVAILQANEPEAIRNEVEDFISQGYEIIKVKVGFEVDQDIERVTIAQRKARGRARVRADANQGYDFAQAKKFVQSLNPGGMEFLEQPLKENEWEAMVELAKVSPIPLGLDESIYGIEAVEKAGRLRCARFVKFKIMKMGSGDALAQGIETAKKFGFEVVLGNGAAGEISCYHEALIASKMITRAGEMNGFLKQKESILAEGLETQGGKIILQPEFSLKLDPRKVNRFATDRWIMA
jgi:L-alanine-DL-glutamate epimerase-like enolase superfamily enzyme